MEILSEFEAWWAPVVIIFGVLASLDKAFDLYKKYKGLAQAPDKKQDDEIIKLRKEVDMLKDGFLRVQDALARDLHRFEKIDELSRLNLQGTYALLKGQLTGDNVPAMQKSMDEIEGYLMKGATNHGSNGN